MYFVRLAPRPCTESKTMAGNSDSSDCVRVHGFHASEGQVWQRLTACSGVRSCQKRIFVLFLYHYISYMPMKTAVTQRSTQGRGVPVSGHAATFHMPTSSCLDDCLLSADCVVLQSTAPRSNLQDAHMNGHRRGSLTGACRGNCLQLSEDVTAEMPEGPFDVILSRYAAAHLQEVVWILLDLKWSSCFRRST